MGFDPLGLPLHRAIVAGDADLGAGRASLRAGAECGFFAAGTGGTSFTGSPGVECSTYPGLDRDG